MHPDIPPLDLLATAVDRIAALTRLRRRTGAGHDDADDTVGSIASDDAIGFDPRPLLAVLDAAGVRVVVIGQVAGILNGSTELTGDLDLLWDGDPAAAPALAAAFGSLDARLTDDDGNRLDCDPAAFTRDKVQFATGQASGDCCTVRLDWGPMDVHGYLERASTAGYVHYLAVDDVVEMQYTVGRPKDRRRMAEMRALHGLAEYG